MANHNLSSSRLTLMQIAGFGTITNQLRPSPLNPGTQTMQVGIADEKAELGGRPERDAVDRDFVKKAAVDELHALLSLDLDAENKNLGKLEERYQKLGSLDVKKLSADGMLELGLSGQK